MSDYIIGIGELIALSAEHTDVLHIYTRRGCSWCGTMNDLHAEVCTFCRHQPHVSRAQCRCAECQAVYRELVQE